MLVNSTVCLKRLRNIHSACELYATLGQNGLSIAYTHELHEQMCGQWREGSNNPLRQLKWNNIWLL
jgi:hypothetical protein